MEQITELADALRNTIPNGILEHYAEQQRLTTYGVCGMVVLNHLDWAERLFNDNSLFSLEDIMHDFVGLVSNDSQFIPRI